MICNWNNKTRSKQSCGRVEYAITFLSVMPTDTSQAFQLNNALFWTPTISKRGAMRKMETYFFGFVTLLLLLPGSIYVYSMPNVTACSEGAAYKSLITFPWSTIVTNAMLQRCKSVKQSFCCTNVIWLPSCCSNVIRYAVQPFHCPVIQRGLCPPDRLACCWVELACWRERCCWRKKKSSSWARTCIPTPTCRWYRGTLKRLTRQNLNTSRWALYRLYFRVYKVVTFRTIIWKYSCWQLFILNELMYL